MRIWERKCKYSLEEWEFKNVDRYSNSIIYMIQNWLTKKDFVYKK